MYFMDIQATNESIIIMSIGFRGIHYYGFETYHLLLAAFRTVKHLTAKYTTATTYSSFVPAKSQLTISQRKTVKLRNAEITF